MHLAAIFGLATVVARVAALRQVSDVRSIKADVNAFDLNYEELDGPDREDDPENPPDLERRQVDSSSAGSREPCALINEQWKELDSEDDLEVAADLAQECLLTIPFDQALAAEFLTEIRKYVEFQSTLEALKDPPDTYASEPVDILGGLDDIKDKIEASDYSSHYQLERDIFDLFAAANDGHFYVTLCTLDLFRFRFNNNFGIVEISEDGLELPRLYLHKDSWHLSSGNASAVSPVAYLNGSEPLEYLKPVANRDSRHDPDARHNAMLRSDNAGVAGYSSRRGVFIQGRGVWQGSGSIEIEYENGTTQYLPAYADFGSKSFASITDGRDLFNKFCLPSRTALSARQAEPPTTTETGLPETEPETEPLETSASTAVTPAKTAGPTSYPEPIIRDPYNQVVGFNLENDDETAVLVVASFAASRDGLPDNQSTVWSDTAAQFLEDSAASGRKRLIVDVSSNGGGSISRALHLFKLFFPSEFPYQATRIRRQPALEILATQLQNLDQAQAQSVDLAYQGQVRPDQESGFTSLEAWLGDGTEFGVPVTSLHATFNYTARSTDQYPIYGYGAAATADSETKPPPFAADDILIVSDGKCGSACTIFVNLMIQVGNVRTIAFGGRPQTGPMQVMGGVRSAQALSYADIERYVLNAETYGDESLLSAQQRASVSDIMPRPLADWPVLVEGGRVTFRNAYQEGDDDTPLQFTYQAADCRLFYTAKNIVEPATVWQSAKDAIWGENPRCVEESREGEGSRENSSGGGNGDDGSRQESSGGGNEGNENTAVTRGGNIAMVLAVVALVAVFVDQL